MDQIDKAIAAAAAQPQALTLTLSSTGRTAMLPMNPTITELQDLAGWASTQVMAMLIGTMAQMQQQLPKPTVLDTPRGPIAVVPKPD